MRELPRSFRIGAAVGAALGAATGAALLLQTLTADQQVSFFGSAFGALVAALTAFGVVEYSAHAQRRAGRKILVELLRRVDAPMRDELDDDADAVPLAERLEVQSRSLDQAIGVAEDLRSSVPGAAATLLYLQNLRAGLGELVGEDKKPTSRESFDRQREGTRSTVPICLALLDRR